MKTMIKGGFLGGIVFFVWGMVSWMVLPWHGQTLKAFQDEPAMKSVLSANALEQGVYVLPACVNNTNLSPDEKKSKMQAQCQQMENGPFAFLVMNPHGVGPMWRSMIKALLIQILGAMLVTALLVRSRIPSYFGRLFFILIFAASAGVLCYLPSWNWWGFPCAYTLLEIGDLVAGCFFAGLILAWVTAKTVASPPAA